jgi:ribosomal protein L29
LRAREAAKMSRTPSDADNDKLDDLADLKLEQEALRYQRSTGRSVGRRTMVELVHEIRSIRRELGIGSEADLSLDELMDGR